MGEYERLWLPDRRENSMSADSSSEVYSSEV
jgi:hypothetical protein